MSALARALRPGPLHAVFAVPAAAAAFLVYAAIRAGQFGFSPGMCVAGLGAGFMVVYVLGIPALVAAGWLGAARSRRAAARAQQRRCVGCGYELAPSGSAVCPECGRSAAAAPPSLTDFDIRLLAGFTALVLAGTLAGSATAEVLLSLDDARFRAQATRAAAAGAGSHSRPRAWPHGDAQLWFVPGRGYEVVD